MKTLTTALILATSIVTLTSCGSSKSSQATTTTVQSSTVENTGTKIITSCQKAVGTDMSVNISAVKTSAGTINNSLVKIKFNRLSSTATAAGNTISFFKWRVSGSSASLDSTPLEVIRYDLPTNRVDYSTAANSIIASTVSLSHGFYINLKDADGVYQVLKAVVYNSSGTVVTQQNILIPQFLAVPSDYAKNSDGSARAQILKDLHPLATTDVTGWKSTTYVNYFQATCF